MVIGAEVKDNLSGKKTHVYAKQVINATGPFADSLRQMSDPSKPSIIMPSAGMLASPRLNPCYYTICAYQIPKPQLVSGMTTCMSTKVRSTRLVMSVCLCHEQAKSHTLFTPHHFWVAVAYHILCLEFWTCNEHQADSCVTCAGVHVTLPDYYSPEHLGMIVPKTKDGRVVFMLPWLDATIAGTTGPACLPALS